MDENSIWLRYVAMWTSGLTQQQIADRAGVNQGTISRWLTGTKLPTEGAKVAAFARGFGRNVLEAFVAARMLSLEEAMEGLPLESWELIKHMHSDAADELLGPDEEEAPEDRRDYVYPKRGRSSDRETHDSDAAIAALDRGLRKTRPARTREEMQQLEADAARDEGQA